MRRTKQREYFRETMLAFNELGIDHMTDDFLSQCRELDYPPQMGVEAIQKFAEKLGLKAHSLRRAWNDYMRLTMNQVSLLRRENLDIDDNIPHKMVLSFARGNVVWLVGDNVAFNSDVFNLIWIRL